MKKLTSKDQHNTIILIKKIEENKFEIKVFLVNDWLGINTSKKIVIEKYDTVIFSKSYSNSHIPYMTEAKKYNIKVTGNSKSAGIKFNTNRETLLKIVGAVLGVSYEIEIVKNYIKNTILDSIFSCKI